MRLIDADAMEKQAYDDVHYHAELEDWEFDVLTHYLDHAPTVVLFLWSDARIAEKRTKKQGLNLACMSKNA